MTQTAMKERARSAADRKLTVALTFDFDAESYWIDWHSEDGFSCCGIARNLRCNGGVPRIRKLLEKYDLPATLFVPGYTADRHPDVVGTIADAGHEIGRHG